MDTVGTNDTDIVVSEDTTIATRIELREQRIPHVEEALLRGESERDVIIHFTKLWNLKPLTIRRYITAVHETSKQDGTRTKDTKRDMVRSKLNYLYKQSLKSNDVKIALQAQKQLIQLDDLALEKQAMRAALYTQVNITDTHAVTERIKQLEAEVIHPQITEGEIVDIDAKAS